MSNVSSPKIRQGEYERWHSFANVLLIATTVLFTGISIGFMKDAVQLTIVSAFCGLVAIVLTVGWFALEYPAKAGEKPPLLIWASLFFGAQVGFLFVALAVNLL